MVDALVAVLLAVVSFLVRHLPASPFSSLVFGVSEVTGVSINQILAWVNWIVPFEGCFLLMTAWLAALNLAIVIKAFLGVAKSSVGVASR